MTNARKAAEQLVKAPAKYKVVTIQLQSIDENDASTLEEFGSSRAESISELKNDYRNTILRVVYPDGNSREW